MSSGVSMSGVARHWAPRSCTSTSPTSELLRIDSKRYHKVGCVCGVGVRFKKDTANTDGSRSASPAHAHRIQARRLTHMYTASLKLNQTSVRHTVRGATQRVEQRESSPWPEGMCTLCLCLWYCPTTRLLQGDANSCPSAWCCATHALQSPRLSVPRSSRTEISESSPGQRTQRSTKIKGERMTT